MLRFFQLIIILCGFFYFNIAQALQSEWSGIQEAKVRLISPLSKNGENNIIYLGLEYQLQKGWKTYWRDPGEGGFPQTLNWSKSTNISELEILWPTPKEFEILKLKSIGYEDEVIFPLKIKLENINLSSNFLFDINFLTCKDVCIPGYANLQLILPAGKGKLTDHSFILEKYLSKIPLVNNKINGFEITNVSAIQDKKNISINITSRSNISFVEPKFFLDTDFDLPVISPQYAYSADQKNIDVTFVFDKFLFIKDKFDLAVLLKDKNTAIEYKTSVKIKNKSNLFFSKQSYLNIFIIALLGGFILNFMPCVLPVLSIKLLSILNNNQSSLLSIRKSFFITSAGIISSFLLLALIMISLRFGGISIGWGMQFQQPLFLMLIAILLFLFSLNLFGLFEFNLPNFISNSLNISIGNKRAFSDYLNGLLVTILATPCSAPFVGTAITVAFTQSPLIMLGIFFFMSLGMASPFLLAGVFPQSVKLLPKPGPWMNNIKYVFAILLLATLVWIGMILNNHFNYIFLIISVILVLILIFSIKFFQTKKILPITIIIIFFLSLNFFSILSKDKQVNEIGWKDLESVNAINNLVNNNRIVFVDVTADWCATCQFNKINVLNSELIQNTFKDNNIIKIRGDWTKPSKKIEDYLNSYNRFGIPFNVMYNQSYPEGIILSEILTTKEIINTIKKLKKGSK